ncbi:MAG: sugar transferase [Flavobacteriales bacterium]|jgi:lipopolysaccharide/colanic/teichoic acid biosynthesis glycosyltransferase|nr:sugar transferase [Flavobacteriales bacterium]MDP4716101.1 sugar transferase [Flavobacteriales bacterium]MDP4732238.1 sugar transferase [Flavobacteriales bacterium]MDP4818003.1 sugar transferase [Flavobacteriales bacterium]MDP4951790.1 sugar transferase [Flavobacteriales bacterium]
MKRLFDIVFSLALIVVLLPVGFVVSIWIVLDDFGSPFFVQQRVGLGGKNFGLLKFRSMRKNAESKGQLTVGMKDNRITRSGYFIRKYKIDELPQLVNVFLGEMSVVGPRPEVPKYVLLYNEEQQNVLSIKPGITDFASIEYVRENELLSASSDPEKTYIEEIMPAKLELNLKYLREQSFLTDMKIILQTIKAIL